MHPQINIFSKLLFQKCKGYNCIHRRLPLSLWPKTFISRIKILCSCLRQRSEEDSAAPRFSCYFLSVIVLGHHFPFCPSLQLHLAWIATLLISVHTAPCAHDFASLAKSHQQVSVQSLGGPLQGSQRLFRTGSRLPAQTGPNAF